MTRNWCSAVSAGIRVTLQIIPNAKKSEIVGIVEDALKIKLQAPPVDGKANEALIRYVADRLGVPKSTVSLIYGQASRRKVLEVCVPHLTVEEVERLLAA